MEKKVLAFDFGASGGRAMCGTFDGEKITIEELHRFSNDPVILNGTMYWDVLRLFFEIKQGLIKAKNAERSRVSVLIHGAWISAWWMPRADSLRTRSTTVTAVQRACLKKASR